MSNILKYQNPSSPLLNPHKIIENIPAREWGPYKINEDYTVTEGKGTNFLRTPFQYWGKKGLGLQNEKLARDLISDFDKMKKENPDYDYTLDKNYKAYEGAVHYIDHLEGLKKYLGLPYDTSALVESAYKPTRLQGTNEKTYKFKSSTAPGYWNGTVEDMIMGEYDKRGGYYDQSLNEYTAYRDRDEKGDFISIYDEWDYNPAVRGGNKKLNKVIDFVTGGKPFVIYDRIYLDDYYDVPEEARGNPFITPAVVTAYKKGGRIHIKKKNRGKFTEYCGGKVTEECIAKGKKSKDPKIRKRATFAANARKWKHENGGILKAQEGTGNGFWSKLWTAVKEGGMAARDAKIGAVGAQQVRDLYSDGKNQEAQDLAKQYAKANTTGIALAGGAASTGLLGDLMVTGATTLADTFIDGDTENFGKNLVKNTAGDLIGHGVFKGLRYFNGKPIFVKEMENGIGEGLYHLDYGDAKGAFKSGSYIKNGYLYPGKTDVDGQLDYIWFNESKPYATAVRGKPFSRTIIFDQKDIPGILRVREQKYPIGQWNGKSGFVTKHEMVTSNPIDMDNATVYKRIPIFNTWLRTK